LALDILHLVHDLSLVAHYGLVEIGLIFIVNGVLIDLGGVHSTTLANLLLLPSTLRLSCVGDDDLLIIYLEK
jgi:hypothetical protein